MTPEFYYASAVCLPRHLRVLVFFAQMLPDLQALLCLPVLYIVRQAHSH
jgi:hypothetical protein